MLFFLADTVLTSLLNLVSCDTTTVFDVVLDLAHTQIQQVVTANFLTKRFVIRVNCTAVVGLVFIFNVITSLR